MNYLDILTVVIAQSEIEPSPDSLGYELVIWKWVVIIAVAAFVLIFAIKRIADIVVKKKTEMMIEDVVGKEASANTSGWVEENDDDNDDDNNDEDDENSVHD